MLYLTGIIISLFLVLILLTKKDKSQADKYLACWLFFTGLHLLSFNVFVTGQYRQFPFLLGLELPMPLVHGPFLFLYVSALTNPHPVRKTFLLHFVPFLVALLSLLPFFLLPTEEKVRVFEQQGAGYEQLLSLLYIGILLSGVSYSLLSLQKLYRHKKTIGDTFSFTEKINLLWLRYLILGSVMIWLIVIFGTDELVYSAIVFYMVFIGYFGIKQVGIFTNKNTDAHYQPPAELAVAHSAVQKMEEEGQSPKVKYEKSGLTASQLQSIHQQLVQLMQGEKLYLNPELTLAELAQRLQVHPNTLSQVINTQEQKNFFDYINCQRVEAFKQLVLLPESQKYTLLSLAFECGFNSKTSFNRNFKKATDLSPTEYLKEININLQ